MKVCVDKSLCIGCGMCAGIEPSVFQMDADGLASAAPSITADAENNVKQAMDECPAGAISENEG